MKISTILYSAVFPLAIGVVLFSCGNKNMQSIEDKTTMPPNNPFAKPSDLPFQTADFSAMKDRDFKPAIEAGIQQQLSEIKAIAENTDAPTFENTLVAMEKSGEILRRVNGVFDWLSAANTNAVLQKVSEEIAPDLSAVRDAMFLNRALFNRVHAIYKQRDRLKLDPESHRLVEYYYQTFILSGANLSDDAKERLKNLNREEAGLQAKFSNQLLAAQRGGALVVSDKAALAGLSDADLEAAAALAQSNNHPGKWMLALENTTQQPLLQSLSVRATRQKLFEAARSRAEKNDSNDTRNTLSRLAMIRAQKAKCIGFPNYAALTLVDQMAQTPETVEQFLAGLIPAATAQATLEAADIQQVMDAQNGGFHLEPYDWAFYAEQVRHDQFFLDQNQVKSYFELNNVLQNGVFYAANQLYGLTFNERKDLPVYHPDVRVFEVFDQDGTSIALFYCDYFTRENKNGGAWMGNLVGQSKLLGTKPVIYNISNFTKPAEGQPALISFEDVTTMFHEFGHALHGMFADQQYPSLSGTQTARDFVEFPSQFNEHWALDSRVFRHYAKHYQTGEPMPQAWVDKIKKAVTFNQGYHLTEILAAAAIDMQWHSLSADLPLQNPDTFEQQALRTTHLDLPQVPSRYGSSYFLHIWSGGYASGYYAYLWSEMLNDDAFEWFQAHGGLTRENGQRFRDMILSRGNTQDLATLYRDFRGRDPDTQVILKRLRLR